MKRILLIIIVLTAMVFADAPIGVSYERPLFAQGKIKVQLTETAVNSELLKIDNETETYSLTGLKSLDKLTKKYSVKFIKKAHLEAKNKEIEKGLGLDRWYLMDIPEEADVLKVIKDFNKDKNVEFANPEYLMYTQAVPTDPLYASQWGHNNTAQMKEWKEGDTYNHTGTAVGTVGFDARAQAGWDSLQGYGNSTIIIGIIDSGVDTGHEDIDDVTGYDFGNGDTNPMDDATGAGHGTCCAGVAAGIVNNGKGVAGVAGNCKIMPLKVANSAGSMPFTSIEDALIWGADNGAHVLSMSLGAAVSPGYSPATDAAIVYAYNAGCTILAATGNENASSISYPANHINVIGVGAVAPDGGRKDPSSIDGEYWWGSNYGTAIANDAGAVDFIAPCILPTTDISGEAGYQSGSYYIYFNGTSSSTSYAAGFAALIKSKYPAYTPDQVTSLMKSSCTDVVNVESCAGWDKYSGYGIINIEAALCEAGSPSATPNVALSVASISTTAAPEGTDTDSFCINNSGTASLNYTITKEYVTTKADITVETNDFESGLVYTDSGAVTWGAVSGLTANCAKATGNSSGLALAILTSGTFDGTQCTALTLNFDQIISKNSNKSSSFVVQYFNGSTWVEIYSSTSSTIASQSLPLPVLAANMQIRFTANISAKKGVDTWSIDNVVVSGAALGPVYTWLTISSPTSGSVTPAGNNVINLICDAAGLTEGTYNANVTIASNDPDEPSKILPVEFIVCQPAVAPGVPTNIVTSISATNLVIDWDEPADATSYDVYSSDDPYGTFTYVTNVPTNQYTIATTAARMFYYIVAKN